MPFYIHAMKSKTRKKGTFKPIPLVKGLRTVDASKTKRRWVQDKKGFFLIRANHQIRKIEVAFCTNRNVRKLRIIGTKAEDIYYAILRKGIVKRIDHAAYLGSELQKAEIALKYRINYVQDEPLDIKDKKVKNYRV